MIWSADTINTIIITSIIITTTSLMLIRWILQSEHNSVYPTIFTLIHNLITYTTLRTNHPKSKNTFTMAKYPPKFLKSQPNLRTRAHRHVKVKLSKNRKMEAMEVNAIMENWTGRTETDTAAKTTSITSYNSMDSTMRNALSKGKNPRPP